MRRSSHRLRPIRTHRPNRYDWRRSDRWSGSRAQVSDLADDSPVAVGPAHGTSPLRHDSRPVRERGRRAENGSDARRRPVQLQWTDVGRFPKRHLPLCWPCTRRDNRPGRYSRCAGEGTRCNCRRVPGVAYRRDFADDPSVPRVRLASLPGGRFVSPMTKAVEDQHQLGDSVRPAMSHVGPKPSPRRSSAVLRK